MTIFLLMVDSREADKATKEILSMGANNVECRPGNWDNRLTVEAPDDVADDLQWRLEAYFRIGRPVILRDVENRRVFDYR